MRQALAIVAAAATGIQVGGAAVATRVVVDQAGPVTLALFRYLIGAACLAPAWLALARVRIAPRDLLPMALLGIVQFGVLIVLLNVGLARVPAGRASLIFASFPLLTLVIAAALGHERLSLPKLAGVLLTMAGVGVAVGAPGAAAPGVGELAVLAAALCGATCSVLYRPYVRRYPALAVGATAMLASVVFLAVAAVWVEGLWRAPPRLTPAGWLAVLGIGLSSGVGYFLWLWALRHAPATQVTVFLALSPVTAALLGALLLDEPVTAALLAGLGAVALGIAVAYRPAGTRETRRRS